MLNISFSIYITLIFHSINVMLSQPNLCENSKIDTISYIDDQRMFFFTSGGYYWLIKDSELPPPLEKGKPLPNGFKIGEASVFKNTLATCDSVDTAGKPKPREQEIYLVEMTKSGNQVMVFDMRDFSWKPPHNWDQDRSIGRAKVDWNKQIDAMFNYKTTEIYVVQGDRYAGVDYKNLCENPDGFAKPFDGQQTTDFNTKDPIIALTMINNRDLMMFHEKTYYMVDVKTNSKNGKIETEKRDEKIIGKDFFKFGDVCPTVGPPAASGGPAPAPEATPEQTKSEGVGGGGGGGGATTQSSDHEKGGDLFIIIAIIFVVVVIIIIALFAVFGMIRKKKDDPEAGKDAESVGASKSSVDGKAGEGSKVSPNQTGSKVNLSQTGAAMAGSSSMGGISPSKMSVRSNMSAVPSGAAGKSSAVSSGVHKKSSVKSSVSKK